MDRIVEQFGHSRREERISREQNVANSSHSVCGCQQMMTNGKAGNNGEIRRHPDEHSVHLWWVVRHDSSEFRNGGNWNCELWNVSKTAYLRIFLPPIHSTFDRYTFDWICCGNRLKWNDENLVAKKMWKFISTKTEIPNLRYCDRKLIALYHWMAVSLTPHFETETH